MVHALLWCTKHIQLAVSFPDAQAVATIIVARIHGAFLLLKAWIVNVLR